MTYEPKFSVVEGADWQEAIEVIDNDTNAPLDLTGATVVLEVNDSCGDAVVSRSTADATIDFPTTNTIRWTFRADELGSLDTAMTYRIKCLITLDGGTFALFNGTLAYLI